MSGSVEDEENTVTGAAINNPLRRMTRLTQPRRDAYGPSAAELGLLATLDRQGAPQMLGLIAGAGAERIRATNAYEDALGDVNAQQGVLAEMANATERRGQDVRLVTTAMQTPNAASAFPMVTTLASPDGRNFLTELSNAELALRKSQAEENLAQAERARRAGSSGTDDALPPAQVRGVFSDADRAGTAAANAYLRSIRAPNTFTIGTGGTVIPAPGTAPLTPEQRAEAEARFRTARQERLNILSAADPRLGAVITRGTGAPAQAPTPAPQAAPAPTTTTAPLTPAPTETAPTVRPLPAGMTADQVLQQARNSIAQGRPRDAVIQRLREFGIDPARL